MTISIAWIRTLPGGAEELVFASDSRLRGGYEWDTAQKVFPLPGLNAVISFAGDTALALPIVHQILSSCENHAPIKTGASDIHDVFGHVLQLVNSMRADFSQANPQLLKEMDESTFFIIGGYSHVTRSLYFCRLNYSQRRKKFSRTRPTSWLHGVEPVKIKGRRSRKIMAFAGDYCHEFYNRLRARLRRERTGFFDMEPLEVLIGMLRENGVAGGFDAIGGAPQMVKVYESRNYLPYAVRWNYRGAQTVHLFGRPFMKYEKTVYPILDPGDMDIVYPLSLASNKSRREEMMHRLLESESYVVRKSLCSVLRQRFGL